MPPSLPTATQVVDPEAQETARTFGRGEYDAVVFQVGAVGPAPAVEGVASSPTSARVVTVESVATPILLTVDTASPLPPEPTPNDSAIVPSTSRFVRAVKGSMREWSASLPMRVHDVTAFGGVRPANTSATPWQANRAIRVRVPIVALPTWGRSVTLGAVSKRGLTAGSPANTSSPAA